MGKKSGKSGRQQYEELAEAVAAPIAAGFGIRIYDVEYVREGQEYFLNVYIDKDGGVTINDCEDVSRLLSDALDEKDFLRDPYTLIVSSPGLGRALTKDRHLAQSIGQEVEIHLYSPLPQTGEKDLFGELAGFDGDHVEVLAQITPPAPSGKGGKGKVGKKKKAEAAQASEDAVAAEQPGGLQKLVLERKAIASIRLAFDF